MKGSFFSHSMTVPCAQSSIKIYFEVPCTLLNTSEISWNAGQVFPSNVSISPHKCSLGKKMLRLQIRNNNKDVQISKVFQLMRFNGKCYKIFEPLKSPSLIEVYGIWIMLQVIKQQNNEWYWKLGNLMKLAMKVRVFEKGRNGLRSRILSFTDIRYGHANAWNLAKIFTE